MSFKIDKEIKGEKLDRVIKDKMDRICLLINMSVHIEKKHLPEINRKTYQILRLKNGNWENGDHEHHNYASGDSTSGQGDNTGTFVWCHSNETYKDGCLKGASKFPKWFIIWSCMSFKRPRRSH